MGVSVSRVMSAFARPFREYNLQDRAHKAVIRNREVAAPKHESTKRLIEMSIDRLPKEVKEELAKTSPQFGARLQKVFVTSQDVTPVQPLSRYNPDRPLPLNRSPVAPPEYGYRDPKKVPYGKTTLSNAMQFIVKHQEDPEQDSAQVIAIKHKLDETLTADVLKYFGTFRLLMPSDATDQEIDSLKQINASPTHMPNTPEMRSTFSAIAMKHKPTTDTEALPVRQIRLRVDDGQKPGDRTLLDPSGEQSEENVTAGSADGEETAKSNDKNNEGLLDQTDASRQFKLKKDEFGKNTVM